MDVGGYLKCKGRRYYSAAANARSGFASSPQMLIYVVLMRDWYIVCFTQGKELSKWMKDGWTGQESHWGWQAGDLRLELQQIQLKSVSESGQGGNPLSCEMSHWTCRYWFMFHYNFTDSSKNLANCTIFDPKLVREEISVNKSLFRLFFSTFKQVTFFSCGSNISLWAKSEDSDQSFASPSRFRNTAFSFLHGRGCHVLADDIWYHSSVLIELLRLTLTVSEGGRAFEKPGRHLSSVTHRRALHVIKLLLAEASLLEDKNLNSRQKTISVRVWHT